ncbi:MAG: PIG-L family deacetylase [Pirellulaceae bacterium]|nr:PIG-L family deacetylase [Pirellulaceae bacterium]
MHSLTLSNIKHVLCLGAHPDDIEIGCGGLLLNLLAANPKIQMDWVVMSANETRKREAEASFATWCQNRTQCRLICQTFSDSFFPCESRELKQALHRLASELRPDLILTTRRADLHQDHRLLAELTWNAFRDHLIWEYEIPKYDGDLGRPNLFFPLTEDVARIKIKRLMTHFESQHAKSWYRPETFESLMRIRAIECNAASGFAEAFEAAKVSLTVAS